MNDLAIQFIIQYDEYKHSIYLLNFRLRSVFSLSLSLSDHFHFEEAFLLPSSFSIYKSEKKNRLKNQTKKGEKVTTTG